MKLTLFVGLVALIIICFPKVYALVPVEGILLGEAKEELQNDPLKSIFSDIYDHSQEGETKKIKLYQSTILSGIHLIENCSTLRPSTYSNPESEKLAKRSVVSTLQYIGLDTTIKALGAYANNLKLERENFDRLKRNLINNYCSENITVYSLRMIDKSLDYYYRNPMTSIIPSIESSPYSTEIAKNVSDKTSARSKEFDHVIRSFRAFCSWGNDVDDYRMLSSFLSNPFIMAFVIKNLNGVQDQILDRLMKVVTVTSDATVQVGCNNLICRKKTFSDFKKDFPLSVGSTGLSTDLQKLYCHHFRFKSFEKSPVSQVNNWIKNLTLEDPIFETSQFISMMTGVPDFFNGMENYQDLTSIVRSSIDERWKKWATKSLSSFSKDLLFEEPLKIKIEPLRDIAKLAAYGFSIDLSISLGEIDKILSSNDKFKAEFFLKLSKNYFRHIRTKLDVLEKNIDTDGIEKFKDEVANYIDIQIREKEKYFFQSMWTKDFSRLIAEELVQQARNYSGSMFNSYEDQVMRIPVNFNYGLFALSYIRYRADLSTGRIKKNL